MEIPTMQSRQPQTNDRRVLPPPSVESANLRTGKLVETPRPSKYSTTVALALKEKTGFPTYAAFVEKNKHVYPRSLKESTGSREHRQNAKPHCAIIDLSRGNLPAANVSLRNVNLSAIQTLSALSESPKDVSVRVVMLSIPCEDCLGFASEFPSVLGLGMNLTPRFFEALTAQLKRHAKFEVSNNALFRCKYLLASGTVVAIARQSSLAKPESPSIVLVAGPAGVHDLVDQGALHEMLFDSQQIHESVDKDRSPQSDGPDSEGAVCYARMLSSFVDRNQICADNCDDLLLASLLPLLQLDILRIRELCSVVQRYFVKLKLPTYTNNGQEIIEHLTPSPGEDETPEKLYRHRTILRSMIEQFEGEAEPLAAFVSSQIGGHLTERSAFREIESSRHWVLKEARRLEAEIRDYLQVQAGHLALLESRKSIELSNFQIQESKRVKIFTILAFVYVPLNLATSVFGMNLQQLNGSGRSFGDFIGTAAIALVLTGGTWWIMEQLHYFLAWRKRGAEAQLHPTQHPGYAISVRLTMIAWLMCNGHWSWMLKSGAGWHILINSSSGFRYKYRFTAWVVASKDLTAGDYVSKFANQSLDRLTEEYTINPFDIEAGHWTDPKTDLAASTKSSV